MTLVIPPFPAVAQHIESPDVEKEVKRLLCSDAEAINAFVSFYTNIFCAVCSTSNALGGKPRFWYLCADVNVQNLELGVMLLLARNSTFT